MPWSKKKKLDLEDKHATRKKRCKYIWPVMAIFWFKSQMVLQSMSLEKKRTLTNFDLSLVAYSY